MNLSNIFKTVSIRHYASTDKTKVILGIKWGVVDEIKVTLSMDMFNSVMKRLNEISEDILTPTASVKKSKK